MKKKIRLITLILTFLMITGSVAFAGYETPGPKKSTINYTLVVEQTL